MPKAVPRRRTAAQLERDVTGVLKKPAMTLKRADEVIRAAHLEGFGGQCGRVAIAINHVMFGDKGRYVVATNPHINERPAWKRLGEGRYFMAHVAVEWKGRLFDARGLVDDESLVEDWASINYQDPEYAFLGLTEEEALDGQLHYIDDVYSSRAAQERAIEAGTHGQCPLRDVEQALRKALSS